MNPRIPAIVVLLALAGIVIFWISSREEKSQVEALPNEQQPVLSPSSVISPSAAPGRHADATPDSTLSLDQQPGRARPAEITASGLAILPGTRDLMSDLHKPENPASQDLELLEEVFSKYRQVFGQNPPGGTNAEITASLTGKNTKALAIVPPDFPAVNPDGELIDRWGTPYFFHPVSRRVMEVLSAGPDGLLWTGDDIGSIVPAGPEDQLQ